MQAQSPILCSDGCVFTQHAAPLATARRVGEELLKHLAPLNVPATEYREMSASCTAKAGDPVTGPRTSALVL